MASRIRRPGYYGRARWDRPARFVYNHFQCAGGLLWLAEGAGAPRPRLLAAKRAVLGSGRNNAAQCAAVRRLLDWNSVASLLTVGTRPARWDTVRRRRQAPFG